MVLRGIAAREELPSLISCSNHTRNPNFKVSRLYS